MTKRKNTRKARRWRLVFVDTKHCGDVLLAIQEKIQKGHYRHIDKVADAKGYMWDVEVREVLPKQRPNRKWWTPARLKLYGGEVLPRGKK